MTLTAAKFIKIEIDLSNTTSILERWILRILPQMDSIIDIFDLYVVP